MNVFMAAVYTNNYMPGQKHYKDDLNERERHVMRNIPHILESYHYVNKQQYVDAMRNDSATVFMDSGAFSAYTLGVKIDLPTYVNYLKTNIDIIRVEDGALMAAVLDGIGDPLETYQNQLKMESLGVRPMPCFHAGEDTRYLDWYVANYDYISLGGMVGTSSKQLMTWLDRMWDNHLVDGAGRAKIKIHGFGITALPIMERYPWYSCDSSSWIQAASFGSIVEPDHGPLSISDKSPSRHTRGQHISNLSPVEMEYIFQKLEAQGFTYERLSTTYQSRAAYNLWAYGVINTLVDAKYNEKFRGDIQELF